MTKNNCERCAKYDIILKDRDAFAEIFRSAITIVLNANDFFGYASADAIQIDLGLGTKVLYRLTREYGYTGIEAAMAASRDMMPLKEVMTEKFLDAYNSITLEEKKVLAEDESVADWPTLHGKIKMLEEKLQHCTCTSRRRC